MWSRWESWRVIVGILAPTALVVWLVWLVPLGDGVMWQAAPPTLPPGYNLYDGCPWDDASFPRTPIAEILADPWRFDGKLVRVRGEYTEVSRLRGPLCEPSTVVPSDATPVTVPGLGAPRGAWGVQEGGSVLGAELWMSGRGPRVSSSYLGIARGTPLDLRGRVDVVLVGLPCRQDRVQAHVALLVRRNDPWIPWGGPLGPPPPPPHLDPIRCRPDAPNSAEQTADNQERCRSVPSAATRPPVMRPDVDARAARGLAYAGNVWAARRP